MHHDGHKNSPRIATLKQADENLLLPLAALGGNINSINNGYLKFYDSEPACELAKHMECQLIQYMVLNATKMSTDEILRKLRRVAMCWKPHREQVRRTAMIINDIKDRLGKLT